MSYMLAGNKNIFIAFWTDWLNDVLTTKYGNRCVLGFYIDLFINFVYKLASFRKRSIEC